MISRRRFLQATGGVVLAAAATNALAAGEPEEFQYLTINDMHCIDNDDRAFFQSVVDGVLKMDPAPDFVILPGDQAHSGYVEQLTLIHDLFGKLPMPVYYVRGNHDIENGDENYDKVCPDARNYSFGHKGWRFIIVDTARAVEKTTLDYLDALLPNIDVKTPLVLVSHRSLTASVPYRVKNPELITKRFEKHNLRAIHCGHFHGLCAERVGKTLITCGPCCTFRNHNHNSNPARGYLSLRTSKGDILAPSFIEVKELKK
jgi:predicted phosphodiesterase